MTTYTRESMLDLCRRGIVPVEKWGDRDSSAAQRQLGEAQALIASGCEFSVVKDDERGGVLWVLIDFPGFNAFEYGRDETESERFYVPTDKRLSDRQGGDWY